jgi:nitrous oxidase accessory protein
MASLVLVVGMLPAVGALDLQAMIDDAEPGSVLMIPAGTYDGNVVVDKPLELRGEGWPVVDGHGSGNVIEITSSDVTISGLKIINTGDSLDQENAGVSATAPRVTVVNNRFENVLFGIFLRRGDDSLVADNVIGAMPVELGRRGDGIRLWESPRSIVERNIVDGGRDTVLWFSDDLILRDNQVTNGRYGVHFMYSDRALVEGNYLSGNSVGGFLMYSHDLVLKDNLITNNHGPSGYGVGLKDIDGVTATGNHFLSNRIGIYFDNSPSTPGITHDISGNLFGYNDFGVAFLPSVHGNVLVGNAFVDNGEQVGVHGKGEFLGNNQWTVSNAGNHWSDFAGYDADGDGVGDVPYQLADLFSTLTDNNADLQFFDQTPASKAIDLAGRMFPAFRPRPKLADTAPLIEMPHLPSPVVLPSSGSAAGTGVVALALLAAAAIILKIGRAPLRRST